MKVVRRIQKPVTAKAGCSLFPKHRSRMRPASDKPTTRGPIIDQCSRISPYFWNIVRYSWY
jgi:hypothetical protein